MYVRIKRAQSPRYSFFFFNDTATTEIYTLSLHDALPIWVGGAHGIVDDDPPRHPEMQPELRAVLAGLAPEELPAAMRSEEHTSELQSRQYLVCRLLLEKKKHKKIY